MHGSQALNPYLSGNFAPTRSEDDFDLEIVGEFPTDLAGTYYRNGPNPQFEPRGHYHWFTGDGMIHGFFVQAGKVSYRNRYVRTPKWQLEHAADKALFGGFDPGAADPSVMDSAARLRGLLDWQQSGLSQARHLCLVGFASRLSSEPFTPALEPRGRPA